MAAYRYWKITNVVTRTDAYNAVAFAEINFINDKNIICTASNASASSVDTARGRIIANAFDKNISTIYGNNSTEPKSDWWFVYDFKEPVIVTNVAVQMRQDMQQSWGYEWQTADVYVSDDAVNWIKYGYIEPKIAQMDLSLNTVAIVRYPYIKGNSKQDNGVASRFVLINDWQTGDFIKKITPLANGDWEYIPRNSNKLIISHIGAEGFAPRIDGPITPVAI